MMGNCERCYYFTRNERSEWGICHRYPFAHDKLKDFYCGEFRDKNSPYDDERKMVRR